MAIVPRRDDVISDNGLVTQRWITFFENLSAQVDAIEDQIVNFNAHFVRQGLTLTDPNLVNFYSCPTNKHAVLSSFVVVNVGTSNRYISVHLVPEGEQPTVNNLIASNNPLQVQKSLNFDFMKDVTLMPGDSIYVGIDGIGRVNILVSIKEIA